VRRACARQSLPFRPVAHYRYHRRLQCRLHPRLRRSDGCGDGGASTPPDRTSPATAGSAGTVSGHHDDTRRTYRPRRHTGNAAVQAGYCGRRRRCHSSTTTTVLSDSCPRNDRRVTIGQR